MFKKCIKLVVALYAIVNNGVYAQYDARAEELLNMVSKKYDNIKSYKAEFVYELDNAQAQVNEKFSGEIYVKGSKFNLKLGSQEIFNNGSTVWTYMKEENEVNVSNYSPDEDDLNPTKIHNIYKKGFKYLLNEDEDIKGVGYKVVELVPEDKKKPFFKIRIWINKKDNSIFRWKIFEKNGNRYLYTINKFNTSIKLDDSQFTFDKSKYPGVEVVDLR
jgi:outer membrane lipoprotein-sorting protein